MQNAPVAAQVAAPVSMNAEQVSAPQMSSSLAQPQLAPSQLPPQSMNPHLQAPMTSNKTSFGLTELCTYVLFIFSSDNMMQSAPVASALPAPVPMDQDQGMQPAGPSVPAQTASLANPSQMPQQHLQQQAPVPNYPQQPANSKLFYLLV